MMGAVHKNALELTHDQSTHDHKPGNSLRHSTVGRNGDSGIESQLKDVLDHYLSFQPPLLS
jgi:hypothetical protein